jgi:cation transport regulator ChaC
MDAELMARTDAGDVAWIFGYGSLLWRPGFRFAERQPAVLRGWMRRFWQASPDHRGAPEAPGRVVTLRRAADSSCWGMAFRVAGPDRADVLAALDHREKAGYRRIESRLHLADGRRVRGLFYVAAMDNPNDLGPAPLASIAEQVCGAIGPSGSNIDYVLRLNRALTGMGVVDAHVAGLARLVEVTLKRHDSGI